jgi:hypothetical protein
MESSAQIYDVPESHSNIEQENKPMSSWDEIIEINQLFRIGTLNVLAHSS